MRKTEEIPVITNITIEPFLSRELFVLSDRAGVQLKMALVPHMEYWEYGDIYSKAEMIFVWLNLDSMVPDWDDGNVESLKEHVSSIGHLCRDICAYIASVSQAKVIMALFEDYSTHLPIVAGYENNITVDEMNRSLQKVDFMDTSKNRSLKVLFGKKYLNII